VAIFSGEKPLMKARDICLPINSGNDKKLMKALTLKANLQTLAQIIFNFPRN
jgi:hypothetical protein